MRSGQAATEYLAMVGIALLLATPLMIQMQESSFRLQNSYNNGLAQNALNNIETAASLVHTQGAPARVTFRIRLPDNIAYTNITGQHMHISRQVNGDEQHTYTFLDFNVTGEIPTRAGVHQMVAEAGEGYVNVTAQ